MLHSLLCDNNDLSMPQIKKIADCNKSLVQLHQINDQSGLRRSSLIGNWIVVRQMLLVISNYNW